MYWDFSRDIIHWPWPQGAFHRTGREIRVWKHNTSYTLQSITREANKILWELILEKVFIQPWRYSRWPFNKIWYHGPCWGTGEYERLVEKELAEESRNKGSKCVQPTYILYKGILGRWERWVQLILNLKCQFDFHSTGDYCFKVESDKNQR